MDEVTRHVMVQHRSSAKGGENLTSLATPWSLAKRNNEVQSFGNRWRSQSTEYSDRPSSVGGDTRHASGLHLASLASTTASGRLRVKARSVKTFSEVMRQKSNQTMIRKTSGRKSDPQADQRRRSMHRLTSKDSHQPHSRGKDSSSERGSVSSRRGSAETRSTVSVPEEPIEAKSEAHFQKADSLERLWEQVRGIRPQIVVHDGTEDTDLKARANTTQAIAVSMEAVCNVFTQPFKEKHSLKELAQAEIHREPSAVDRMLQQSRVIAAVGRRQFDSEEIGDGRDPDDLDTEEDEAKKKIQNAKPRYLDMFAKPEDPEGEKKQPAFDTNPKSYGLWDSVADVKILPTLIRVKREWQPPDWEKTLESLKQEGRDLASIDNDLKEISHEREQGRKKTGKYLMPEDLSWLRKHCRFKEKDLLKWFRRFRQACPLGAMNRNDFEKLFKTAYPLSETENLTEVVFDKLEAEPKVGLDFKDFAVVIDVLNCDQLQNKIRWAFSICDSEKSGAVDRRDLHSMITIMDQIYDNGFMNPPTDEEVEERMYRRDHEPFKLPEDRVEDVLSACELNPDGRAPLESLITITERVIFARD